MFTIYDGDRPAQTGRRRRKNTTPWVAVVSISFAGLFIFGFLLLAISRATREPEQLSHRIEPEQPRLSDKKELELTPAKLPAYQEIEQKQTKRPDKVVSRKFEEWASSGDLHVRVMWGHSNAHISGYVGDNSRLNLLVLHVQAKNTHAGKIIEWPGWRNKGVVEDEFGNKFSPAGGWSLFMGAANDFPSRIPPTQRDPIPAVLYFERVPDTSKTITVTLPLDDKLVKFMGKHN